MRTLLWSPGLASFSRRRTKLLSFEICDGCTRGKPSRMTAMLASSIVCSCRRCNFGGCLIRLRVVPSPIRSGADECWPRDLSKPYCTSQLRTPVPRLFQYHHPQTDYKQAPAILRVSFSAWSSLLFVRRSSLLKPLLPQQPWLQRQRINGWVITKSPLLFF